MDEDKQKTNGASDVTIETESDTSGVDAANALLDVEQMINSTLGRIETLSQETSKLNEMMTSVLENDETYVAHSEAAKEAGKVKNATKSEIVKRPDVAHTVEKLREVRADLKETKEALSGYLYEYSRLSGSDEFEAQDGSVRRIVVNAKLVKG